MSESQSTRRLSDPVAIRALSHPVRLALLEALVLHGELTATRAGELIGESATTCSFHLRQLAKYGFVEEAEPGPGRTRPWRATSIGFSSDADDETDTIASRIAADRLTGLWLQRVLDRSETWRQQQAEAAEPWRDIGVTSQTVSWLTADETTELQREIEELLERYAPRADPQNRPADSEPVEILALLHPILSLEQRPRGDRADDRHPEENRAES